MLRLYYVFLLPVLLSLYYPLYDMRVELMDYSSVLFFTEIAFNPQKDCTIPHLLPEAHKIRMHWPIPLLFDLVGKRLGLHAELKFY